MPSARPARYSAGMLKTRIIPCLDVADGRVVKGVNFVDLIDAGDPVEAAIAYDAAGADELCFLDINATHENRGTLFDLARRTAEHCFMPLTVGGGVRTPDDVGHIFILDRAWDRFLKNHGMLLPSWFKTAVREQPNWLKKHTP